MSASPSYDPLPEPQLNQAYVEVSALEAGTLDLPMNFFLMGAPPTEVYACPSLAFSIRHAQSGAHLVFDLGLRRDVASLPPLVQGYVAKVMPYTVPQSVDESLAKGGIDPKDVQTVVVSHVHFDHIGDPAPFPNATFVLGESSRELLANGYPANPKSDILQDTVPLERTRFLPASAFSASVGPFPRAHDYFGDGSLYLIDAAGHLPGHLNVLARTSTDGAWIFLGADCAHDTRLLTGEKQVAFAHDAQGKMLCVHADKDEAVAFIRRVGALLGVPRVQVLLAHDRKWYAENKGGDAFLPGKIAPL